MTEQEILEIEDILKANSLKIQHYVTSMTSRDYDYGLTPIDTDGTTVHPYNFFINVLLRPYAFSSAPVKQYDLLTRALLCIAAINLIPELFAGTPYMRYTNLISNTDGYYTKSDDGNFDSSRKFKI